MGEGKTKQFSIDNNKEKEEENIQLSPLFFFSSQSVFYYSCSLQLFGTLNVCRVGRLQGVQQENLAILLAYISYGPFEFPTCFLIPHVFVFVFHVNLKLQLLTVGNISYPVSLNHCFPKQVPQDIHGSYKEEKVLWSNCREISDYTS